MSWCPTDVLRQVELWDASHRYILCEGPRKAGKSVGIQHKVMRHAVQHPFAKVGLFSRSIKQTKQGAWSDITGPIMRRWRADRMTEFTVEPRHEMDTKMAYCRVLCEDGKSESEIQIHTIGVDEDVEEKFKDTRFSMMYIIEADRFDESTFAGLAMQLRSLEVPIEFQQMILDCNPPAEGVDHWLHKRFFEPMVGMNPDTWASQYRRIHFDIDDNPYLSPFEKQDIHDQYAYDPIKLQRYYYGKWVRDDSESVFANNLRPDIHIIGEPRGATAEDLNTVSILRPPKSSFTLHTGWDMGDVNHAIVFGAVWPDGDAMALGAFDEIMHIGSTINLDDVVEQVVEKIKYWTDYCTTKHGRAPRWMHWSDSSSLRFKASLQGTEAALIERLSAGLIRLDGVEKGSGSVGRRLNFIKRLMQEERFFCSTACPTLIDMFRSLKPGSRRGEAVDPTSKWKHPFDALTYMGAYAMPEEMLASAIDGDARPTLAPITL